MGKVSELSSLVAAGFLAVASASDLEAKVYDSSTPKFYCAALPEPYEHFDPPRHYSHPEAHKNHMKKWNKFSYKLLQITDQYLKTPSSEIANCALDSLHEWAQSGVFNEDSYKDNQGHFERMWAAGTLNLAYAKIKNDPNLDQDKAARVESWLENMIPKIHSFFDDWAEETNSEYRKHSNLMAWAGFTSVVYGINFGDEKAIEWGIDKYDKITTQISQEGLLPHELTRKEMAFWYHNFALRALVATAEIAESQGIDLYSRNGGSIHRLASLIIESFEDFGNFQRLSPHKQIHDAKYLLTENVKELDWMEILYARFGEERFLPYLETIRKKQSTISRRTGGNPTLNWGLRINPLIIP